MTNSNTHSNSSTNSLAAFSIPEGYGAAQHTPQPQSTSTGLMNPQEVQDLLKQCRHLYHQRQAAEKNLAEVTITTAELLSLTVKRVPHGQQQDVYRAAGMSPSAVSNAMRVKRMLDSSNSLPAKHLPSMAVMIEIAGKGVPQPLRNELLHTDGLTKQDARDRIATAKAEQAKAGRERDVVTDIPPPAKATPVEPPEPVATPAPEPAPQPDLRLDAYAVIGLIPTASDAVVKAAIRAAKAEHHPDHGGDTDEFAQIQSAADTIEELRREARAEAETLQAQRYSAAIEALGGL